LFGCPAVANVRSFMSTLKLLLVFFVALLLDRFEVTNCDILKIYTFLANCATFVEPGRIRTLDCWTSSMVGLVGLDSFRLSTAYSDLAYCTTVINRHLYLYLTVKSRQKIFIHKYAFDGRRFFVDTYMISCKLWWKQRNYKMS
jgi:hypothetical protein